ncbi:MAG: translation factor GTPase family protein [Lachnospiraceae bacterium]
MEANNIVLGILAHVDAGKTTLAEGLLYKTGNLKNLGRVDNGNAFLDTFSMERERGITIFSKEARLTFPGSLVTLVDTPGHIDFSAEMERTLQVLDYAILVISGTDGVQSHVYTLWRLLKKHNIPTFLFVNKMDLIGSDKEQIMKALTKELDGCCIDFTQTNHEEFLEQISMCDELLLDEYLGTGCVEQSSIIDAIARRNVFACYFGSALRLEGVDALIDGLDLYMKSKEYAKEFAARVYKISRDEKGNRLTHMKITGGTLKARALIGEDKVNQIRFYSGEQFIAGQDAAAGDLCAVTGLTKTYSGEGLGIAKESEEPLLEPVLNYKIELLEPMDVYQVFLKLRQLEEEDPQLHLVWNEEHAQIHIQLMGEVQVEVLQSIIFERFGIPVQFGKGSIVYKETIVDAIEGVGHFEPLRHYAEVHIYMEPLERGSGIQCYVDCSEDILDKNWQKLVLTHLEEKIHKGILVGAELTDVKITLVTGRAHQKHTEGGDFRQATYRAVRHGLMRTQNVLLEPVYQFRLEIPSEQLGRAISDIQMMHGSFEIENSFDGDAVLVGTAPVATMQGYHATVLSYTKGTGKLAVALRGYEVCHNQEEVIAEIGYLPESDIKEPASSVFCSHGAGFSVPWEDVERYMHLEYVREEKKTIVQEEYMDILPSRRGNVSEMAIGQDEIEEIFKRTYGSNERNKKGWEKHTPRASYDYTAQDTAKTNYTLNNHQKKEEYLLVDGYNIIFAWDELKVIAEVNIDGARTRLMDMLSNYQGFKKNKVIVVFDAYRVARHTETIEQYHNITVIFTKIAETADHYIEKTVEALKNQYHITVATSDALEQMIIWGRGAMRMSAKGLLEELWLTQGMIAETIEQNRDKERYYAFEALTASLKPFNKE